MSLRPFIRLILASICIVFAGCDQSPSTSAASALAIGNARAPASAQDADVGAGNGYAFHIRYPQLPTEWAPLADALHAYAAARKKDFLDARLADDSTNAQPYDLDIEFNVVRHTADFVSVLSSGSAYTGGAHGNPVLVSFNLHPEDGRLLGIDDLFADAPAALKALSEESRRQLEGRYDAAAHGGSEKQRTTDRTQAYAWIERGTEPKADSFKVFLIDGLDNRAIGLTLIFPPYQVAAYADGPQQIEVPAKVFYGLLKAEYRDAFIIDTEAPAQRTNG